ncbi:MAG: hypothetical protein ACK4KV_05545 [Rhodocyclaceae bacterium]
MAKPNLKLRLQFDFELGAPDALLAQDHEALCKAVSDALGQLVLGGTQAITGKQLAKAGIAVMGRHHHLEVINLTVRPLARTDLIAAGPHLTDDELEQLARRAQAKAPEGGEALQRHLRRHALALMNEYRMVSCVVDGTLSSGQPAHLAAQLNLTNGSVLVDEQDRKQKLATHVALLVKVGGGSESASGCDLTAACAGHTLSGPVIEVPVAQLAEHRDLLIRNWQRR